ncbi:helix-turn-helix domain-containing protein [Sphingobacterium thalpophilum]|uniref:helix-turn-helix domain-containing protein n=1 Tax=Sphingobacterium thalpophilum TaxID=259 RepID=UPI0024A722C9|nr:helix-turn-helix domain-containing protein [Sphingobacterium thalpophilum]
MNLSEKESKVLTLIIAGSLMITAISEQSELSATSVNAVINSLVTKGLVQRNDNKSVSLTDTGKRYVDSLNESNNPEVPVETKKNSIPVVIPYLKSEAAGEELRYALRSWDQHFLEEHRVIVVGDKEDWFSPEITHIPLDPVLILEDCNCAAPAQVRNPQADVTNKILTLIASGELSGDFILTNDDIFLAGPTTLTDIKVLKAFGDLEDHAKGTSLFCENAMRTKRVLSKEGLPTHHYGTHTPMYLNPELMAEIIDKYNATEKGFLLTSLYFNTRFPDARPIQITGNIHDGMLASVYRDTVDPGMMWDLFHQRKFINCNSKGWTSVQKVVAKVFPQPSKYEQ